MNTQRLNRLGLVASLALLAVSCPALTHAQSGLIREVYPGNFFGGVANLTNHVSFPDHPSEKGILAEFEAPSGYGDFYGQRVRGYLVPPQSGNYTFWISSDDQSQLFVSTDESRVNRRFVAEVLTWTNPRQWDKEANQRSLPIALEAGKRYYIEALMVEGAGGDNLAVRWQLPDFTMEEPIGNNRLLAELIPPTITMAPANLRVVENTTATFTVGTQNEGPLQFQWLRNNDPIPGATNISLVLPSVGVVDNGARFRVAITNLFGNALSSEAILTVDRDTLPPKLVGVSNPGTPDVVVVTFNEPVEKTSAEIRGNYEITRGVVVHTATLDRDGRTVILSVSPLSQGPLYEIIVSGVRDRADRPNVIDGDNYGQFRFESKTLPFELVHGKAEQPGPSSRRTGLVISEIMHNPSTRADGRNVEFIELYNTQEFPENVGGYSIAGSVSYTIPAGVTLAGRSYLVIATKPADVRTVYGLNTVYGGFANELPNKSGTIQLRNAHGAVLLTVEYDSSHPWPVAADGAGHSMVLARPSLGEGDGNAWAASSVVGGSPGRDELVVANPQLGLVINEFLAHTDDPQLDFVELHNFGSRPLDISGCWLSDNPRTNRFRIPPGTVLAAGGHIVFDQNALGFALSARGETIYLRDPSGNRMIDVVRFGPQENGVSSGRYPDGSPGFVQLSSPTPGTANKPEAPASVVINEIMYHPPNEVDEFVELHNPTAKAVDLSGWKLDEGIRHTFQAGTIIPAGGFLVVARDIAALRAVHPHLNAANSVGNFDGNLSNSGEAISLSKPQVTISTNASNQVVSEVSHVVVNRVDYRDGGRWGRWSDGGGSSMELRNALADNRSPSNWGDSDESKKSAWTLVERTGHMNFGALGLAEANPTRSLHVILLGEGEVLLDNVEVIPAGGTNIVANSTFEGGLRDWQMGGTHEDSGLMTMEGFESRQSLAIRASGRGDTAANRIRVKLTAGLTNNTLVTIRARARWLKGSPELLLRLHGNYLEAEGNLPVPRNLGTPGMANSVSTGNLGPVISDVKPDPVLPRINQSVSIIARIADPDRVANAQLIYRIEPSTNLLVAPMAHGGGGYYFGTIPGQPAGTSVAFHIDAVDRLGEHRLFPDGAPGNEGVVRFGEMTPTGRLATYRLWMTQRNITRWAQREQSSNKPLHGTFIYNNQRVFYGAGAMYSGSPFHWRSYNSPLGNSANYVVLFPKDDLFLGETDTVLNLPSNMASDTTGVREQTAFWMANQVGQPANHRRFHHLLINGVHRGAGSVFEDAQQPNRTMVEQWYPNESEGQLYKIEDWFEFNDGFSFVNRDADLEAVRSTNAVTGALELKKERYRWMWRKRAVSGSANDYGPLFELIEAVNHPDPAVFAAQTTRLVDIASWMGAIALRHAVGDWDAYGYRRGKNMYAYKPDNGQWKLMHWDIAFSFGLGDGTSTDLFSVNRFDGTPDRITKRMMDHPPFRRVYLQTLQELVDKGFNAAQVNSVIDARQNALLANGVGVSSADSVKAWIQNRRAFMIGELSKAAAPFAITSNGGNNFNTNRNGVTLTGSAPLSVYGIAVNGVPTPVVWTSPNTWSLRVVLTGRENLVRISGLDKEGKALGQASAAIQILYTGTTEEAIGKVVLNEAHYMPENPDAEFIELHNTSRTSSFDLSGYRLNGVDFTFPPGSIIAPSGFLVVARDAIAFGRGFGFGIPLAGVYAGRLDNDGETLSLLRPMLGGGEQIVSAFRYENRLPWPAAGGTGASLQVVDPTRDVSRVGNWMARGTETTPGRTNSVAAEYAAFPLVWLNELLPVNMGNARDGSGELAPWVELYNAGTAEASLAGLFLSDSATNLGKWAFPEGAKLAGGERRLVWLDGQVEESTAAEWHASFRASEGSGILLLSGPQAGKLVVFDYLAYTNLPPRRSFGAFPDGQAIRRQSFHRATPGEANDATPEPVVVKINEWMASNTSTLPNPLDGAFDDWFELYNPGMDPADLSGFTLRDSPTGGGFRLPMGTIVPPGGFLLIWADEKTGPGLHANFKLSASGEMILLVNPAGETIDSVTFGRQTADVSEGRLADGGLEIGRLPHPTPGRSNSAGPATPIAFVSVQHAGGQISLVWTSQPEVGYQIQATSTVGDGASWEVVGTVTASGTTAAFTEPANVAARFYRVARP